MVVSCEYTDGEPESVLFKLNELGEREPPFTHAEGGARGPLIDIKPNWVLSASAGEFSAEPGLDGARTWTVGTGITRRGGCLGLVEFVTTAGIGGAVSGTWKGADDDEEDSVEARARRDGVGGASPNVVRRLRCLDSLLVPGLRSGDVSRTVGRSSRVDLERAEAKEERLKERQVERSKDSRGEKVLLRVWLDRGDTADRRPSSEVWCVICV